MKKLLILIAILLLTSCTSDLPMGSDLSPVQSILSTIDSSVVVVDEIDTVNGKRKIKNVDDNTNETFIIASDREKYYGSEGDFDVILAITNLRAEEFGILKFKYSKGEKINSISKYIPVASTIDVPVYSDVKIKTATSSYIVSKQTGTITKDIIKDTWDNIRLSNKKNKTSILQKETVGVYDDKEVKYLFPKGTTILKVNISHEADIKDKFYIEVFGENGGYGMLDPIIDSLIAYWKLDETSGTRADAHASYDMADLNTVLYEAGKINNAAVFVAAQVEALSLNDIAGMEPSGDFSVSLWLKPNDVADSSSVFTKDLVSNRSFLMYTSNDNSVTASINDATPVGTGADQAPDGTWTHIVYTYDYVGNGSSVATIYADADEKATRSDAVGPMFNGSAAWQMGARAYTISRMPLQGSIDEVGFWHKELTQAEVTALYNSGDGLAYPLTEPTADTAEDPVSGSGMLEL